jgi:hypothetical protein
MDNRKQHRPEDDPKTERERMQADRDAERDSTMAPRQNRPPAQEHRGGPLPNQKK